MDTTPKNKIFPELFRRNSRIQQNNARVTINNNWTNNRPPQRPPYLGMENNMKQPVVVINDILPAPREISSFMKISRNTTNGDVFYRAIGPVLVLGQLFGQLPVTGILDKGASSLKFKWLSWRVLYSMGFMLSGLIMVFFCIARLFHAGVNIHTVSMLIFYGSTCLTTILFFRLAPKWPMLCRAIEREESRSLPHLTVGRRGTLKTKFQLHSFVILFTALLEHLASVASGVSMVYGCDRNNPLVTAFYTSSYPQIFAFTSYAPWKAVALQIFNFVSTFNWNFMDLFIILISLTLVMKFQNINQTVLSAKGKHLSENFWKVTRNEYANLSNLVCLIDENINELILLSFINNLYIICMQLFNTFDTSHDDSVETPCWKKLYNGIFTTIYFVFSFVFLISRFLAVSISASRIYTNSKIPLNTLFSVSSETYCIEVQRFLDQVTNDIVAFTGLRFFHITRGLILTIAGTVVTYELVLVQFNQPPPSVRANITLKDNCGGIDSIKTSD